MTPPDPAILLFTRARVLGSVKGRLAVEIGEQAALEAHCQLVENAVARLADLADDACIREVWVAGGLDDPGPRAWVAQLGQSWRAILREQSGADLGLRMHNALNTHVQGGRSAVLLGTDVPPIDSGLVRRAFEALRHKDLVIAPCEDGGYGLIGVRRPVLEIFTKMEWGRPTVTRTTLERAEAVGYSVAVLDLLWDVDTLDDWHRFQSWKQPSHPGS